MQSTTLHFPRFHKRTQKTIENLKNVVFRVGPKQPPSSDGPWREIQNAPPEYL